WHLTTGAVKPFKNLLRVAWPQLLQFLIDPSWGITYDVNNPLISDANAIVLKQGRADAARALQTQAKELKSVLPYIQTEVGQTAWDILSVYAQRIGVLINLGPRGELIFYRPDYTQPPSYSFTYQDVGGSVTATASNNLIGTPRLSQSADGLYTEVTC